MKSAITMIVTCVAGLVALGLVMLYSSSMAMVYGKAHIEVGAHFLILQSAWCVVGVIACAVAVLIDYRHLKKFAWPLLGLAVLMLLAVLIPAFPTVFVRINGAKRWIRVAGFTIQPSELAKVALIIALALYCEINLRQMALFKRGIVIPGLFICVVLGLIFIEPDVGNALLLGSVCSVMLIVAGIKLRYFLPPVMAIALGVGIFIYNNPMRSARIYSWLHVEETRQDKGRQAYEAMNAFGSGGWTGLGLGNGREKFGFMPEHTTDFIFPIIGEELGLVATMLVVIAFLTIIWCGIFVAMNAREAFGMLLATGVTFLIGMQAFINIGVVTGVLPNKGLSLPFISYGGSNLFMMLVCTGILLSVARRGKDPEPVSSNPFAGRLPEPETT